MNDNRRRVPVDIRQTTTGRALILSIIGDIDVATIPSVDATLHAAVATPPGLVVIDLTAVAGISVAGMRLVKSLADACTNREVTVHLVIKPSGIVRRVFTITGLADELTVFDSLDDALGTG